MVASYRDAYHYLVNIDEYPEAQSLARESVRDAVSAADAAEPPETAAGTPYPWRHGDAALARRQVLHYFTQYAPTALVDGCWLQCGLRVATAHTRAGAALTAMYVHQIRAAGPDPRRHLVADYRDVWARLGAPLEEVSSRSLVDRFDLADANFKLPVLLLSLGQFPRTYLPELLGLHLAWQRLGLPAYGPALIRDTCDAFDLPPAGTNLIDDAYLPRGRELAEQAASDVLEAAADGGDQRHRLDRGLKLGAAAWSDWLESVSAGAPQGPADARADMIALIRRKAAHAHGYHGQKQLGGKPIDGYLDPAHFDPERLLDALAASPHVKPGRPGDSPLVRRLVEFGGPMLAVFSPAELAIMRAWIASLAERSEVASVPAVRTVPAPVAEPPAGTLPSHEEFRRASERRFGGCSTRELYHYLVNVEFSPEILPVAERYARDRLERAMATLESGERPIPSPKWDRSALERWVYNKHREQVDSYRPLNGQPRVSREAFVESTVQLAPLVLIDGGWLQGMASASIIHTTVGRMLFHVFCEEIGVGNAAEHHANIYRDLLRAMGEDAPPVESREFAGWTRLKDASFDVPVLWLSLSCFPRHFLPEILGLNLAVELAGVGGPYMEARDTLRFYKLPTLFVNVHNAADNVSVGHAAWAMNAITQYMDELVEREGPHRVDHAWHRIWSGVRATLPQIGRVRLAAHRVSQRLFGPVGAAREPVIFPS